MLEDYVLKYTRVDTYKRVMGCCTCLCAKIIHHVAGLGEFYLVFKARVNLKNNPKWRFIAKLMHCVYFKNNTAKMTLFLELGSNKIYEIIIDQQ